MSRRQSAAVPDDMPPTLKIPPAVPVLHAGAHRPCTKTPQSVVLLGHYLRETAAYFSMTSMKDNPFVTILLPLGYTDDLLMHALLALSGAQLAYQEPDQLELVHTTMLHYSQVVSELRAAVATLREDDVEQKERLLRVLIVVCHYEVRTRVQKGPAWCDDALANTSTDRLSLETHTASYSTIFEPVDTSSYLFWLTRPTKIPSTMSIEKRWASA